VRGAAVLALALLALPSAALAQPEEGRRGALVRIEAGAMHQRQYDEIGMNTGSLNVAVGGEVGSVRLYGHVMAAFGRTLGGLKVVDVRTGGTLELFYGRFHFGFDLQIAPLTFISATGGDDLFSLGFGARTFVGIDLVDLGDDRAFYIDGQAGVRGFPGEDPAGLWEAGGVVGYRF